MNRISLGPAVLIALLTLAANPTPSHPEPARISLDGLMANLLEADTLTRQEALVAIERLGDRAAIPGLIDLMPFDLFLDSSLANALDRLSGQRFGHDWRKWVEWLEKQRDLSPHPGYVAWKGDLFALIDPAFREFLYPGLKHRVRIEEIMWGGVRKDGIPALTNPRHVKARGATYLAPDDLVLGISINGDHRAYPLRIMDWHEMTNDVVGGTPIAISY